jgi:beta-1,4-N-acetylglucosaminyltransferase
MGFNRNLKICLVSSAGGHLAQIKQLIPIVEKYDYFIVTEKNRSTNSLNNNFKVYYLLQQERKNIRFLFVFALNILLSLFYLVKQRPDVIVSTGAGATIPLCLFGKLFGKKIIFIESFAKIKTPTLTGKLIYKIADKFYVQWEEMLKHYPKAEYRGKIY